MAEREILKQFITRRGTHGVEKVDGELFDARGLHGLFNGVSLFAPEKLIILSGAAKNKTLWEALPDWLAKIPPETSLVIIEPAPDKRTKTYKALKVHTEFKEFAVPSDGELAHWLQQLAKQQGTELASADAAYLVTRVGRDQWRLSQELDKLATYPKISRAAIDALVEPTPEGSAFELLDAALAGDAPKVQYIINQLKTEEDPYKLSGLLASQVYALAVAVTAGTRAVEAIAKETGLHPFVLRKTQAAARGLGTQKVKQIVAAVATCDTQLKSTGVDPWYLLGVTLQKIAAVK